ncbi:MAG TPA: penicillin-binding transpeptidase domain-containing protein, partial [Candidatus Limnocylindrales bacterium]|nr:penicillin-binding transpeptidase domain-containing protein [Candidatus Limnocylindrales bacterium]
MATLQPEDVRSISRVRIWYALLLLLIAIFAVRLFYLQVIRYDHFKTAALSDQLKQYEIPATRGAILAYDGGKTIPIVLNQKLYTLYADPSFIKDPTKAARDVRSIIGGDAARYESLMSTKDSRYVILAKKLSPEQHDKITKLEYPGLGTQRQDYRTYPQGTLAAQTLGFVNDEGKGVYGVEQALNGEFTGTPGELKAITDVRGVPLAANAGNIQKPAVAGKDVLLTLDIAMQKQLERILADGVKRAKGQTGSALIMDVKTGAVKGMANYPSYDPAQYNKVEDGSLFANAAVTNAIEVGSTMKPLTVAAALDSGAVRANQTYADPAKYKVDDFNITNIEEDGGPGTRSVTDILNMSLNTGVTWLLMQMGGGT